MPRERTLSEFDFLGHRWRLVETDTVVRIDQRRGDLWFPYDVSPRRPVIHLPEDDDDAPPDQIH